MSKMKITSYDYDEKKEVVEGEHYLSVIARSFKNEKDFSELLSNFLNYGGKDFNTGKAVGNELRNDHRTLQGQAFRFAMGVIVGLSEQEYTDARNAIPVATAKKIAEMIKDGELELGWII